jgi:hypothetical protein
VGGGRDAGLRHQRLRECLRALELRGRRARAEGRDARRLERVDRAGDERRLGADDDEADFPRASGLDDRVDVLGADVGQALGVGRDPGVARRAENLGAVGGAAEGADDRVLAPTAPDDQNPQSDEARSSAGIAASV